MARALPDVRDGLKPVHRRILYSMSEMGLRYNQPYKKAARIVGDVLGKFHPHGDPSVYDALVRMAQDFSLRYPLVDGQGNFGSVDGDPPAAMRYTEARLSKIAEEMLRDIEKETVDFGPNYDDSLQEPLVLPAALPNLLVNGVNGHRGGHGHQHPPAQPPGDRPGDRGGHRQPQAHLRGADADRQGARLPDRRDHLRQDRDPGGLPHGAGKITVRARVSLETSKAGKEVIIVTELPYQVNKANLIIRIADLVKDKKIDGISDLRDESDRRGMRIVIELRKGVLAKVVLNQLFTHTQLQATFGVNCLALVGGKPQVLTLRDMIDHFIAHRQEVVTRRARYDLRKAEERAHILEGLKIALENIDEVIAIIKASKTVDIARSKLMSRFKLSERQAQAILDMRLQRLTSLETRKIIDELKEVLATIAYLKDLLAHPKKILGVIKEETLALAKEYGDERRTEIVNEEAEEINLEDLISKEDMVILISNKGYVKSAPVSTFRNQGRGGKGLMTRLQDGDFIEQLFIGSTHDILLFITSAGRAFWLKIYEIPESSRQARGQHIRTMLSINNNEEITTVVSLKDFREDCYLFMATSKGVVKKVQTTEFVNAKTRGIIAINLDKGDRLVSAMLTEGKHEVVLVTRQGLALRFSEEAVRSMGRASRGITGIRLGKGDELAGVVRIESKSEMLLATEFGYGKRIGYDNFAAHGRGTRGQTAYKVSEKVGEIVGVLATQKSDDVVCITSQGNTIKLRLKEIPIMGKTAMGVRMVNIEKPDQVVGIARVAKEA